MSMNVHVGWKTGIKFMFTQSMFLPHSFNISNGNSPTYYLKHSTYHVKESLVRKYILNYHTLIILHKEKNYLYALQLYLRLLLLK